ncbi:MAG: quinol:electron acceptor oxidoreductase subunit ActD [Anaerolineales bacterium]
MTENKTLLALFEDIDPAADGIEKLHELGIADGQISVISGIPFKGAILGRPSPWTNVPRIGLFGALIGLCVGIFLILGIPALNPLYVGGQPLFPIPPVFIIGFEMSMLGLMGFSFIGVFVESRFPSLEEVDYVPEVSDGKIAVFFKCPVEIQQEAQDSLTNLGAKSVTPTEAHKL